MKAASTEYCLESDKMANTEKKSEWFVGSRHDELLEATRQMRKTQQRMQAQVTFLCVFNTR